MNEPDQRPFPFPSISTLPEEEQAPFIEWLTGQTRPYDPAQSDPKGHYYTWDYDRWKAGKPVID